MPEQKTFFCVVSGQPLSEERVEALRFLGTPEHLWTCIEHSPIQKVKGLFLGKVGRSELRVASDLGRTGIERIETADVRLEEE